MVRYGFTRFKDRLVDNRESVTDTKDATPRVVELEVKESTSLGVTDPFTDTAAMSSEHPQVDPRAFRDGYEPKASDVFVAVMGVTGAGKSTFISKCTEKKVSIGHNLQACTQEVAVFLCKYNDDVNVYLVDTPGFDDTDRSDSDILREIASWLTASYSNKIKLHGIIYLHRITDARMQGSAKRNLYMFKKLCGNNALKNVVLATTMWERVQEELGIQRENQLKEKQDFWGYMLDNGSQIHRHFNHRDSAIRLIESLVGRSSANAKVVLDIQAELVDHGKDLADTAAGQVVEDAITQERKKFASEIAEAQADMRQALADRDRDSADMIKQHQNEINERVRRLDEEHSALKVSMERLQEDRFAKMQRALEAAEAESKKNRDALVALQAEQERRQKVLDEQLKSQSDLNARREVDNEALKEKYQAEFMEQFQEELRKMNITSTPPAPATVRTRSHPGLNHMNTWSVSACFYGSKFFFVAYVSDLYNVSDTFPASRLVANNGNRYIALGQGDSYYIHYHDAANTCWTERSEEFQTLYPEAEAYISTKEQYGCPTCVSLGPSGWYFIRTAWGCSSNLPEDAKSHLGDMSKVEKVWFGKGGAWVATKYDGGRSWDLKGQYAGLDERIREGLKGETRIQEVAINPEDPEQWLILYKNGLAAYNVGSTNLIDSFEIEEWCTKNFGTIWTSK